MAPNDNNGGVVNGIRPLNVLIIGAGLGGLTAAIAIRRQGHHVTIFEQSRLASEYGAAINVPPNAHGVLLHLGVDPAKSGAVEMKWVTEYSKSGDLVKANDFAGFSKGWQHVRYDQIHLGNYSSLTKKKTYLLAHRVDLHTQLKTAATSSDGKGRPAELRIGSKVVDVNMDTATITLADGSTVSGDIVVGADGIHSKTRTKLTDKTPFSSGKSAYRFLLNKKDVLKNPEVGGVVEKDGEMAIWFSTDRRIVMYPTRNNEIFNFVCIHPDQFPEAARDTYNEPGTPENLLQAFDGFDPRALALLKMADPATLKVWKLMDMDQVTSWHTGKLCLLGDAAHPFLPHQGQGGAQAIEDGVALGVLLPFGTKPADVPARLKLYEECRKERAEMVQEFTRQSGADIQPGHLNNAAKVMKFMVYNCAHDEHHHSIQKLREWQHKQRPDLYWRMPISFGPSPGPRQDFRGQRRDNSRSTFVTTSIKFKTSRTLLQNLFPTHSYSFASLDTMAYASYIQTTLGHMDWLGGGGYNYFGLYLHGVQYTKRDGSVLNGTYLPVMFEDLTDPILSGREELGFPKLYSDIDVHHAADSYSMKASWRHAQFVQLELEGLQDHDRSLPQPDDGLFFYKYIPATGERGTADAEYPVCDPEQPPVKLRRSLRASKGSISIHGLDWKSLPTLHHIAERLAELPVFEFVEGTVTEGEGVHDFSRAYRVE